MNIEKNGQVVAVFTGEEQIINDVQSALDLIMTAKYEAGTYSMAVEKKMIAEEFFILSTGLAGEVMQKFVNYQAKLAIFGDFSMYTSKPLKDLMFEMNKGKDIFFVATREEAAEKLIAAGR